MKKEIIEKITPLKGLQLEYDGIQFTLIDYRTNKEQDMIQLITDDDIISISIFDFTSKFLKKYRVISLPAQTGMPQNVLTESLTEIRQLYKKLMDGTISKEVARELNSIKKSEIALLSVMAQVHNNINKK